MAAGELLLELLSEEIPARMQRRAIDDLVALVGDKLAAAEIPARSIRGYVTPRRLAVVAEGLAARQPDRKEERRGPRVGAPEAALGGFLRAAGLASIEECEVRDTDRGEFYFALIERPGRATAEVLPALVQAVIAELPWPKSMRFPAASLHWVRPLNSVICLFDGAVVPLPLDGIPIGRATRGHRFLADGEIAVDGAADYLEKLEAAHVILDHERRRALIAADLDKLAAQEGLKVRLDPGLLDEVAGLVEFPVVLMGRIDDASMALPPEVLATAMRTHQKYFSCLREDGTPAPRFLFVANNRTPDGGKIIVAGNERVLKARLADARFFWDQDRKVRLADRVPALRDRVYYDTLGTMLDKTERIERLAAFLAAQLHPGVTPAQAGVQGQPPQRSALDSRLRGNDEWVALARRAARLAKADLSTGMVGEFPELQGAMGRYYALHDGEDPRVADAIADHYKPLGPGDSCPTKPVSVVLALADKLDTLVGFYGINERPTGSRDPFALRRAALGVLRTIVENNIRISITQLLINHCESSYHELLDFSNTADNISNDVLTFIVDRLKIHLRETGIRTDLIAASVYRERQATDGGAPVVVVVAHRGTLVYEDDLVRLLMRVDALAKFLGSEDGNNLLIAYRRAANIVAIEERRDRCSYDGEPEPRLLQQGEEKALARALASVGDSVGALIGGEDFERAMTALAALRPPVDAFFDKVTVNTDDRALRENRLRLLSRIRAVMNQVADFSQIEG